MVKRDVSSAVCITPQGEVGGPGQKGSKGDKGELVSLLFSFSVIFNVITQLFLYKAMSFK